MADIKINGVSPSGFYYGGTAASAVYYGSTKLWEAAPAGAVIGGKTYPTCTLPDGHEWLAVNLDYAWTGLSVPTSGASITTSPQAVYYNYDEATYGWSGLQRGLLYNWYAVSYLETNKATLCPGWHVPTKAEFEALITAIGESVAGKKLKSTTGWEFNPAVSPYDPNGTDDYGFSAYPCGMFYSKGFTGLNTVFHLWTQTASSDTNAWRYYTNTGTQTLAKLTPSEANKNLQLSVRLIKDY